MTDMIERVAVAINQAMLLHDDYDPDLLARAAIAAMREPTEDMGGAAVTDHDNHAYHMSSYHCVTEAWRNMIDAALGEK
jgi:hypothetical protein